MVKANYAPWHINAKDFSAAQSDVDKLLFFARYAILAPSGHNTQPWLFKVSGNSLLLKVNPAQKLPFSGKLAAEPHVSLGACVETFSQAAKGFGYDLKIEYVLERGVFFRITLEQETNAKPELLAAITSRASNRNPFKRERLPSIDIARIINQDFSNISVQRITTRNDIDFLAEQTYKATRNIMHAKEFRAELSNWVRNNFTRQHDGMPGFVQGMPAPPSLLARHIVKNIDISRFQAKIDATRVANSAEVILLCAQDAHSRSYVNVGRLYARICLIAQSLGYDTSGVGAAVIDPKTRHNITQYYNLEFPPVALIRLGHATKAAGHTPRWPLSQIVEKAN